MKIGNHKLITSYLDNIKYIRPKCKCCNGDIFYDNTILSISNKGINFLGKSYKTQKKIGDTTYTLKVCQSCLLKKFPDIKNLGRTFNVMSPQTQFAFDIPNSVYEKSRKKYAMTLDHMIEKYGEEIGNKRWKEYCEKQALTNTFEYKQKVYGWDKSQFDEYNKSRAVTKSNLIKRHGKKEGLRKWEEYCEKQSITKSWDYMIEKYGEARAREINKQKIICKENFIRKYGEYDGSLKWLSWLKNNNTYSMISQDCFKELDKYFTNYITQYQLKGGEKQIPTSKFNCLLDYYIPELNVCIEFNGGCFHGDSRLYNDDECCNPYFPNITAKELRERDCIRYDTLLKEYGIKTYVIWELDYKNGINLEEFANNIIKENMVV